MLFALGLIASAMKARMLDPSDVARVKAMADRAYEIDALKRSIDELTRTINENGFDATSRQQIRRFFFGDGTRSGSGLSELKDEVNQAGSIARGLMDKVQALEAERREATRRLDERLNQIQDQIRRSVEVTTNQVTAVSAETVKHVGQMVDEMTSFLQTLRQSGLRNTPPEGNLIVKDE